LYPRSTLVHAPVYASWLNQIEISSSTVEWKVLTPNGGSRAKTLLNHSKGLPVGSH
jgi:hypothetical protein